jgi:peptide-methionine (R)-S-oxide reductase
MRRRLFTTGLVSAILTAGSNVVGEASEMAEGFLGRFGGRGASSKSETDKAFEVSLSDEEWRRRLTPQQYHVLRERGTERAGTSPLDKQYGAGIYHCAGCGQPLFDAGAKFNSGTGWPSFSAPLDGAVETNTDRSFFMVRTEVHCHRCGGHLGHVFDDGPQPTGQRYCMNGVSLDFHAGETPSTAAGRGEPGKS